MSQEESPIPPVTDDEIRRHVVITRRDVAEIKAALLGNQYGGSGIVHRLETVEAETKENSRKLLVWGSIISAAGVVLVFLKDLLTFRQS